MQKLQESITTNLTKASEVTVERKEIPNIEKSKAVSGKTKEEGASIMAEELEAKKMKSFGRCGSGEGC